MSKTKTKTNNLLPSTHPNMPGEIIHGWLFGVLGNTESGETILMAVVEPPEMIWEVFSRVESVVSSKTYKRIVRDVRATGATSGELLVHGQLAGSWLALPVPASMTFAHFVSLIAGQFPSMNRVVICSQSAHCGFDRPSESGDPNGELWQLRQYGGQFGGAN